MITDRLPKEMRKLLKAIPGSTAIRDRLYMFPRGAAPTSGSPRPVVYLPTWLEWDVMKQRPQYLMAAMAKAGHEVWFVDTRERAERDVDGVHIVRSLKRVPASEVILYTHFAPTRTLIGRFADPVVVYDILDDLSIYDPDEAGLPETRRVRHHHAGLVRTADVVMVSNPVLEERHSGEREDLVLVENGVDPGLFSPDGPIADGLGQRPTVGYHGALAPWLDFGILERLFRDRVDLRLVLVGPVVSGAEEGLGNLTRLPNVAVFPPQTAEGVATFVRGFDVGLIPFQITEMTKGVTPLKMFEYMAAEVPVVATPLPACVAQPTVRIGSTEAELSARIDEALIVDPGERAAFRRAAEVSSWDQRVARLLDRLEAAGLRFAP